MEMADYERLVKELNSKLTEKDEHAEELKAQINTVSQKQEALKKETGMDDFISAWLFHTERKNSLLDFMSHCLKIAW